MQTIRVVCEFCNRDASNSENITQHHLGLHVDGWIRVEGHVKYYDFCSLECFFNATTTVMKQEKFNDKPIDVSAPLVLKYKTENVMQ